MGLFDKLSEKARGAAESALKTAGEVMDQAKVAAGDLSEKASVGWADLSGKVGTATDDLSAWAETMPGKLRGMADSFDADALWDKLSKTAAKAGQELIVMVLTIYYAVESRLPGNKKEES